MGINGNGQPRERPTPPPRFDVLIPELTKLEPASNWLSGRAFTLRYAKARPGGARLRTAAAPRASSLQCGRVRLAAGPECAYSITAAGRGPVRVRLPAARPDPPAAGSARARVLTALPTRYLAGARPGPRFSHRPSRRGNGGSPWPRGCRNAPPAWSLPWPSRQTGNRSLHPVRIHSCSVGILLARSPHRTARVIGHQHRVLRGGG